MKKLMLCTIALLATMVTSGAFAGTVLEAGEFDGAGQVYSPYSGVFTDVIKFDVASGGLSIVFEGEQTGMAGGQMLLTDTSNGTDYLLDDKNFFEKLSLGKGSYVFTLSGFAMNALDKNVISDYDLSIKAVPLPAAAWLFGSALLGFISFSARRKI
jgi:hypothetical protein